MGLDILELVIAVEDEFDIDLPAEEWWRFETVRDLAIYLTREDSQVCRHLPAFVQARRALMQVCGVPRSSIRVESSLNELLPAHCRPQQWASLSAALEVELPSLVNSHRHFAAAGVGIAVLTMSCILLLPDAFAPAIAAIGGTAILVLMAPGIGVLPRPMPREFDLPRPTVGELTRCIARQQAFLEWHRRRSLSQPTAETYARLRAVIRRVLNVPEHQIHPGSRFIEDLGAD